MATDSLIQQLKIINIREETAEAKTFFLEPQNGWQPEYRAGQFLTLVFYTPHGEKRRSYSIVSSPALHEPLAIMVKKVDNGEFSRPLVYTAKVGDVVYCSGVSGLYTLPENTWPPYFCFIAAGSGVAPCFALIKTILATGHQPVVLFYSSRNRQQAIYYDQLQALQQQYPQRLHIRFLMSDHADIYHKRLSKWLLEHLLDEYLKGKEPETLFYLCGPFDYMQTAEITLLTRTGKSNIVKENFSSLPRLVLPTPPDTSMHRVTIHINKRTYQLDVQYPKSILKSAKEKGIDLPYSCEAGRCSSCIATCTHGKIWMAYNEVLVDREVEKGRVLTCQGFPIGGDAEITYDE